MFAALNKLSVINSISLPIDMTEPVAYNGSLFADGDLPIMFSQLQCSGEESNLQECGKLAYGNFTCSRQNVAGVKCKEGQRINKLYIPYSGLFSRGKILWFDIHG